MYDLIIKNGKVVDGTGSAPRIADVAVVDGKIVEVSENLADQNGSSAETIDAEGKLVTPGFVDIHTHYDGQATWDPVLEPSTSHGVTTIVMGNCGVGFAPVAPGKEEWLIQLMEGVEDIPGSALSEGMTWGWETFPEYLDVLDKGEYAIDIGTQIAHGAVRGYVMDERGTKNEPATPEDIEKMAEIVREAGAAGTLGVSTSRTIAHKAMDGEPVPGTFAAEDELFAMGHAIAESGGVFELAPAGAAGLDLVGPKKEIDWMCRLSAEAGIPVSFALLEVQGAPNLWRELMEESLKASENGAQVFPQIAGRPFGFLVGLQTHHAFTKRPTFMKLAHLPIEELAAELSKPEIKSAILSEQDEDPDPTKLFDAVHLLVQGMLDKLFLLGNPPNYEPSPDQSMAALAEARGMDAFEVAYDALVQDEGKAMCMLPLFNYFHGNMDVIAEQLTHPQAVSGLSDGGAHCGMICDASMPTFMLSHWTRDRSRGKKLPLEWIVKKQTQDTAALFGLTDRGVLSKGKRADINIIDYENLNLNSPKLVHDLPANGRRLLQDAVGYDYTIVAGQITRRNGKDTGARPGRLLRGRR